MPLRVVKTLGRWRAGELLVRQTLRAAVLAGWLLSPLVTFLGVAAIGHALTRDSSDWTCLGVVAGAVAFALPMFSAKQIDAWIDRLARRPRGIFAIGDDGVRFSRWLRTRFVGYAEVKGRELRQLDGPARRRPAAAAA